MNGSKELGVTDLGEKVFSKNPVRVLLAKSTEAITDLKLIMGIQLRLKTVYRSITVKI